MSYNNVFTSTFDAETTGAAPANWTGTWTVQEPGLNSTAKCIGATSAGNSIKRTFAEWNRVRYTFYMKTGSNGAIRQARILAGKATDTLSSNANSAILLLFESTGQVQLFYGASSSSNIQTWAASTEYLIVIEIDCLANTYTVTINGVLYNNSGLGYQFYKANTQSTIGQFYVDQTRTDTFLDEIATDDYVPSGDTEIYSPFQYQVIQRGASNTASIAITGRYSGSPAAIEARFNSGTWATIATNPIEGKFSGTLSSQAAGQGTLQTRVVGGTDAYSQTIVGVGDIIICAGQSNMSGRGTNNQSWSHASLIACLYGNDNNYKQLVDPYDSATGQIDTVSSDTSPAAAGSYIPKIATDYMASQTIPVMFVPTAKGSTAITSWLPGASHVDRTTLYGSMMYRAQSVGATAQSKFIWHQGETDALATMSQATYNGHLDTIANTIASDISGAKLMPCLLQACAAVTQSKIDTINAAITEAWGDNTNVYTGPTFVDLSSEDNPTPGYHFKTDATLSIAGARWFTAILTTLDITPPTVTAKAVNSVQSPVTLTMSEACLSAGATTDWAATVNGISVTISYVVLKSSTQIDIYLNGAVLVGDTVLITYSGTSVTDLSGNKLATFTLQSVVNNSTQTGGGGGSLLFSG